ncbi:MAG TPA: hypothetical protein VLX31_19580 [Streptosporangiaceae bacterium]|nr:hypothetical protein [Streptosporangiaceae bacterium]
MSGTGWNAARREVAVAAGLVAALTAAAWALDGPAAAAVVVIGSVALSLVLLRAVLGHDAELPPHPPGSGPPTQSFRGFWRTQADLADATRSLSAWDMGARRRLTNLFAARLAERHGISLADDPDAARRLLLRRPSRHDLWFWIDPDRPTPPDAGAQRGIPPGALAALIDRLEQL